MRLAREFGTVRELLPDGIDNVRDLPHTLFDAIHRALLIIGFGELAEDEQPPKRIWADNLRLNDWFKEVRRKRARDSESRSGDWNRHIEDPVQNQAALELIPVG